VAGTCNPNRPGRRSTTFEIKMDYTEYLTSLEYRHHVSKKKKKRRREAGQEVTK
jgi:hypothetical protein